MSTIGGSNIVREGLVMYLDAANQKSYVSSSTVWRDLSLNNNSGSLVNGPSFSSANGGSIVFDGVDDSVNTINVSSLTNMTIEMWIYDTRSSGERDILSYNGNSGAYTYNGSTFRTDGNGLAARRFAEVGNPPVNQWYRFCYIKNSDLYINETKYTGIGTDNPYGILSFGNTRSDIGNRLIGRISNIRVYNRNLTQQEVLQNYEALKSRYIY
jgi:hypothetical protein